VYPVRTTIVLNNSAGQFCKYSQTVTQRVSSQLVYDLLLGGNDINSY
jgi:hypothetical protein